MSFAGDDGIVHFNDWIDANDRIEKDNILVEVAHNSKKTKTINAN